MTVIADAQDPIAQARVAWRRGDGDTAFAVLLRAFQATKNADYACLLAAVLHHAGKSRDARDVLLKIIIQAPNYLPAQTQLARIIKIDALAESDEHKNELAVRRGFLADARRALERDPFFLPSAFWTDIATRHERMLDHFGVANFKRTVAHNYQNWLIAEPLDPQWLRLRDIWQREPSDQPLLNSVESVDDTGFIWDITYPFYPLSNPGNLAIYKLSVGILWEFARSRDLHGLLSDFEESTIGNPIRVRRNGILISQDAAHSARELNTLYSAVNISEGERLTFAELGAGHGRLAEMIGSKTPHRYLIFDIPPTLYVSQWYITRRFPDEKVFAFRNFEQWDEVADEVNASRFAFFTPNQIRHFPNNSVDIFVNICSLMEMRKDQIAYFLDRISSMTRTAFFSKQYYQWRNEADHTTVEKSNFQCPGFDLIFDQKDDIHDGLFVQVWKRP